MSVYVKISPVKVSPERKRYVKKDRPPYLIYTYRQINLVIYIDQSNEIWTFLTLLTF